jgi:hypothetical protein
MHSSNNLVDEYILLTADQEYMASAIDEPVVPHQTS